MMTKKQRYVKAGNTAKLLPFEERKALAIKNNHPSYQRRQEKEALKAQLAELEQLVREPTAGMAMFATMAACRRKHKNRGRGVTR